MGAGLFVALTYPKSSLSNLSHTNTTTTRYRQNILIIVERFSRKGILTTPTDQVEQYSCEEEDESCADVFDVLTGRYVTREESDAQTETFENSVDAMLFLHTRHPNDERTATLITAGNEGWIRAWSLHNKVNS